MIEIKNVSKSFGDVQVLDNITCTIKSGAVFGIVGSNGAGKSTTIKMLTGILKPTSGTLAVRGIVMPVKCHYLRGLKMVFRTSPIQPIAQALRAIPARKPVTPGKKTAKMIQKPPGSLR